MNVPAGEDGQIPASACAALARFGERLHEEQRERVIEAARQLEEAAETLRAFLLANGDEPDATFSAVEGLDS